MGFLGGLGAGLAGFGQAAGEYRDKVFDIWQQKKRSAVDQLATLIANEEDPERRTELIGHMHDINSLKVGQDPSKVIKSIQESFAPHPVVKQLVDNAAGAAPAPVERPTAWSGKPETPGTATRSDGLASLLAPGSMRDMLQDEAANRPTPAPAQPPGVHPPPSPVSPSRKAGELKPVPAPLNDLVNHPGDNARLTITNPINYPSANTGLRAVPMQNMQSVAGSANYIPPVTNAPLPAAPAAPTSAPTPYSFPKSRERMMLERAQSLGFSVPPALRKAVEPELRAEAENRAKLQEAQMMAEYTLNQLGPQRMAVLKQSIPGFDKLPPMMQAQVALDAYGMKAPSMPFSLGIPRMLSTGTLGAQAPEGQMDVYGRPISPGDLYRIEEVPLTGEHQWVPIKPNIGTEPTAGGGYETVNRYTGKKLNDLEGATNFGALAPVNTGVNGEGKNVYQRKIDLIAPNLNAGGGVGAVIGRGTNLAALPSQTMRTIQTTDAEGNPVTVLQPVVGGKILPGRGGAVGAGGGGGVGTGTGTPTIGAPTVSVSADRTPEGQKIVGRKGLTPLQMMSRDVDVGTLDITRQRFQNIMRNLPLLNSLISAEKIHMQTDPQMGIVKAFINRNVPLSKEEAELAADFQTAMEDINKLRQPLGATGFRGPEAFAALIAQAGNPRANPEVTKGVIQRTLQSLNRIRDAKGKGIGGRPGSAIPELAPIGSPVDELVKKYGGEKAQ